MSKSRVAVRSRHGSDAKGEAVERALKEGKEQKYPAEIMPLS